MYSKKDQLSKRVDASTINLYDKNIIVRFNKKQLNERVQFLLNKQVCQVCEESYNLDYPHHARFGIAKKDDRFMINICVHCHRIIHNKGFKDLKKTREETEDIGWENNLEYLNEAK